MMDPAQSQALLCMRGRLKNRYISHVRKLTKLLLLLRLKKKKRTLPTQLESLRKPLSTHVVVSYSTASFFFLRSDRLFFIKKKGVAIRPSLHDYKAAARSQSLFRTHGSINESRVFFTWFMFRVQAEQQLIRFLCQKYLARIRSVATTSQHIRSV